MKAPAVSGARSYVELCLAARNEEKQLAELNKRQQYLKSHQPPAQPPRKVTETRTKESSQGRNSRSLECYVCHKQGHIAQDCRAKRTESKGHTKERSTTKVVESTSKPSGQHNVLDMLYSSSEDESDSEARMVRVENKGSQPQCAQVVIQGVPVYGIVDSGADITIMGGKLFHKVAAVARLKKSALKRADKSPRNYNQTLFSLDGRMDLEVTFDGKTMRTAVYIKLDAHDQLLLSEGVCRQLGIIHYHTDVQPWRGGKQQRTAEPSPVMPTDSKQQQSGTVPTVRVSLVQSVRLPPGRGAVVDVQVDSHQPGKSLLLEWNGEREKELGLAVGDALLQPDQDGRARVLLSNHSLHTQQLTPGICLGEAVEVSVIDPSSQDPDRQDKVTPVEELLAAPGVKKLNSAHDVDRQQRLLEIVGKPDLLDDEQTHSLHQFLAEHHQAFCLDPGERGQTDLIQVEINTADATPKRQPLAGCPSQSERRLRGNSRGCRRMEWCPHPIAPGPARW